LNNFESYKSQIYGRSIMSNEMVVRKIYTIVDETIVKGDKRYNRVAVAAVIKNPLSHESGGKVDPLYEYGEVMGQVLGETAIQALRIEGRDVESYGKAAIVGLSGDIEHGHAIIHPRFGAPLRSLLGGADKCRAIIPSTTKTGGAGTVIDIPVHYKDSEWVISHVDTVQLSIPDAPQDDEIVVAVALTDSGRPNARTIGKTKEEVK
jgi:hypothetical protein